jgi:HD-like signal output (HDOD) protein
LPTNWLDAEDDVFFWKKSPDPRTKLRRLIGDYQLPSFSAPAVSTLSLLRSDADMSQIVQRLMADPGLNVRILRRVNSAAFGLRRKVTNLEHAANLLGRSRIESLVLTAAVSDSLPSPSGIDTAGFWQTSARRACLARHLASLLCPSQETEAFTAALLQDMAVPFLAESSLDRYAAIYKRFVIDDSSTLQEMEQGAFGYDHAQVGALMAETWGLPEPLVTAIADHHLPGQCAPLTVEAVSRIRHSYPVDSLEAFRTHCIKQLQLAPVTLDQIIEAAHSESVPLARFMRSPTTRQAAVV